MTVKELIEALKDQDPNMEIEVRNPAGDKDLADTVYLQAFQAGTNPFQRRATIVIDTIQPDDISKGDKLLASST